MTEREKFILTVTIVVLIISFMALFWLIGGAVFQYLILPII